MWNCFCVPRPLRLLIILTPILLVSTLWRSAAAAPPALVVAGDMIAPIYAPDQCLTVDGADPASAPPLVLRTCRNSPAQQWQRDPGASQWRSGLDATYCLATVGNSVGASGALTVRLCSDPRALTLVPDAVTPTIYDISGTVYVLDAGVYGYVAAAFQNGWEFQHWRWFQDDLALVNQYANRNITYPLPVANTLDYEIETARDRVAKVQPPYVPPVQRDPSVYPGVVPSGAPTVTRSYTFNLQFQDHSYLRMSTPPENWQSTGLYAPADQILAVTVSNATASDLRDVYLLIGVHTDRLTPDSGNVADAGEFLRYPNVTTKVKLEPGANLVRSPYGGTIILVSERSVNKIIAVTIAGAVEAPYFVTGRTTEAEWLVRRNAPGPWAEFESELGVAHVPSAEIRTLSFADAFALAEHYSEIGRLHNQLAGLRADAALPHRIPQGKQRHVLDRQISAGYGHSGFPLMYFDDWAIGRPADLVYRSDGWGVYHELGHNYQMGPWSYVYGTEVTVNLFSLFAQEQLFGNSRLVDTNSYATAIARLDNPAITDKWGTGDAFEQLVFLEQIRLAFPALNWEIWTQLMRRYRELSNSAIDALDNDQAKRDKFMVFLCEITQTNLTPHFEAWTIAVTQTAKNSCAAYAPLTQQIWRIDGAQPFHPGVGDGHFRREWWNNLSGTQLISLTSHVNFPSQPSGSGLISGTLSAPTNWGSNFGQRLRAFLHPPVSGHYRFWLAGDDAAQLRLSSAADPLHAQTIITLTTATGQQGFDEQAMRTQRSAAIYLESGRHYYIEVLHKEASGSDHVAVAWTIPVALPPAVNAASPAIPLTHAPEPRKLIAPRFLSPYSGDLTLRQQLAAGQPTAIQAGGLVTLTLTVQNQGAVTAGPVALVNQLPSGFTPEPGRNPGWQSGYRYARFVALSEAGNRGGWASMAELGVLDQQGQPLPKTHWSILYQDSYQPSDPATKAIDNDPATLWHTPWGGVPGYPHEVQVDLGAPYPIGGFSYLPRQSGSNGIVGQYRFYVSEDGADWREVAAGAFADNNQLKTVHFTAPSPRLIFATLSGPLPPQQQTTLHLTLRATATLTNGLYANRAEILHALDGTQAPFYDSDSTPDANSANDPANEDDYALFNIAIGQPVPDQDNDGVDDMIEAAGPNSGDGNGDGTPDAQQAHVASLPAASGTGHLTLAAAGGCSLIEGLTAVSEVQTGGNDPSTAYPLGLIDYRLRCTQPGQSATVQIYWWGVTGSMGWQLRKFGPTTPGNANSAAWYTLPATVTVVSIGGQPVVKSSFTLTDGQLGDATGSDGLIVDPVGLANTPQLAVSKHLNTANPLRAGESAQFTIRITNTSVVTLTTLPLTDLYDSAFLFYQSATPPPDMTVSNNLSWTNVAPAGGLAPGAALAVVVNFAATHDTTLLSATPACAAAGYTVNRAQVVNALAGGSPVAADADDTACAGVQIYAPTAVVLVEKSARYQAGQVILRWRTADNSQVRGFQLWRADESGVMVKLNPTLLVAQPSGQGAEGNYDFIDSTVHPGRTYRYVLESVDNAEQSAYFAVGLVTTGSSLHLPVIQRG